MAAGNRIGAKLLLLAFASALSFILIEAVLRIWPPFDLRVRGNEIVLPVNVEQVIINDGHSPKLDDRITIRRNSLGFRGAEPPEDFGQRLTLLTVGGSTTECSYLNDGKTWPDRLAQRLDENFSELWLNNAGLDGHSTFGHLALFESYLAQLRPDILIFLIGNNDVGRGSPNPMDLELHRDGIDWSSSSAFVKSLAEYSDTIALAISLLRYKRAADLGLVYRGQIDLDELGTVPPPSPEERAALYTMHREEHVPPYRQRLTELIELSRKNGIEPVFVTQPGLYGPAVDDITGIDLATIDRSGSNGNTVWETLELYNETTRQVGLENDVLVIDLAHSLPKSSLYFYDLVHYTNEGAVKIADILHETLCPFLAERFPDHLTAECMSTGSSIGDTPGSDI